MRPHSYRANNAGPQEAASASPQREGPYAPPANPAPLRAYQGRPISVDFDSCPGLYVAIFEQEYDGAPDSNSPVGLGKTEDDAVADLIEKDSE